MPPPQPDAAGHRILPHTADLVVEAWGPTLAECLEEAVKALVGAFTDTSDVVVTRTVPVSIEPSGPEDLLVTVLEEVIYVLEVLGVVPVDVALEGTEDGGVGGCFDVAPVGAVTVTGAIPKAVSLGDLVVEERDGRWECHAIVDV
ncbi:MAG: archease [Acidimicrobiia bacterium]|nr:archease [Acidimicrobiia bacterium]